MKKNSGFSKWGVTFIVLIILALILFLIPKLKKKNTEIQTTKTTYEKTDKVSQKKEIAKGTNEKAEKTSEENLPKSQQNNVDTEKNDTKIIKPPKVIKKVVPEYPKEAKEQRIQGIVVLECQTDKDGNVRDVKVLKGHPVLNQAAIDAVKQWKFEPYKEDGVPKPVKFTITVKFSFK